MPDGFIERTLTVALHRTSQAAAVMVLEGPRGAGKTALLQREFPRWLYITMEDRADRQSVRHDPALFMARLRRDAILDDAHRAPELISHLKNAPQVHRVIIVSPVRLGMPVPTLRLYWPTSAEMDGRAPLPLAMLGHFVPKSRGQSHLVRQDCQLPEGDIQGLIRVHDWDRFERFFRFALGTSGQVLDLQSLADSGGISRTTAVRWLGALEDCFLSFRAEASELSFGRRLVRSPKLHFLQSESFESRAISEIFRNAAHSGANIEPRYWKDSNGLEIPLVLPAAGSSLLGVAIHQQPAPPDFARLRRWMDVAGALRGAMISRTAPEEKRGQILCYALAQL